MFGLYIILAVAAIGGFIAFLGDRVGMKAGKKRLSIFGLRPKYTSITIAVITGILIAVATLVLLAVVSEDVRIALFHLEKIQADLREKTLLVAKKEAEFNKLVKEYLENEKELARVSVQREKIQKELESAVAQYRTAQSNLVKKEGELVAKQKEVETKQQRVASLTDITRQLEEQNEQLQMEKERFLKEIEMYSVESAKLKGNLAQKQTSLLIFDVKEVIVAEVVEGGTDAKQVLNAVIQPLLVKANQIALERGARIEGKNDYAIKVPVKQMNKLAQDIAELDGKAVLRLVAEKNTFFLEPLYVSFELFPNELVFKADEVVAETKVSPAKEESIILQEILNLLLSVRKKAFDRGMISQGQYIGEIASLQDIPNIIQRIKKSGQTRTVQLAVIDDTWRVEGPLKVRVQIKEELTAQPKQ
ncbi:MAG: DUF3084 domain-containing protein [Bacillota bacterium]